MGSSVWHAVAVSQAEQAKQSSEQQHSVAAAAAAAADWEKKMAVRGLSIANTRT